MYMCKPRPHAQVIYKEIQNNNDSVTPPAEYESEPWMKIKFGRTLALHSVKIELPDASAALSFQQVIIYTSMNEFAQSHSWSHGM